ncbi:MAG: sulfite exporter TauE/SafE family protein [Sphingobium sp.]
MHGDPLSIGLAILGAMALGFGKGGLAGIGMIGLPLMVFAFPPVEAAAILLPLLIVQDAFSVCIYRKSWNGPILAWAVPGSIVGIAAGAYFAASVSTGAILALVGSISILFALWRFWTAYHKLGSGPFFDKQWPGSIFGIAAGFTSQVAHAGAPPFQMWVMPKYLPHREFVGTNAIFFAITNWIKVPAYIALGAFSGDTLRYAAMLMPAGILATFLGAWVVDRVNGPAFYAFVNVMLALVGLALLWEAVA